MDLALFGLRVARGEHDHGKIFVDQRVRAVLHLARRIAFGVDIGDLFQLQRAFERDGEVDAAAEVKKILCLGTGASTNSS